MQRAGLDPHEDEVAAQLLQEITSVAQKSNKELLERVRVEVIGQDWTDKNPEHSWTPEAEAKQDLVEQQRQALKEIEETL